MLDEKTIDVAAQDSERWSYSCVTENETTSDAVDRKLRQAAGLSELLLGEGLEAFDSLNNTIRNDILSLLSDTIAEAIGARETEHRLKLIAYQPPVRRPRP